MAGGRRLLRELRVLEQNDHRVTENILTSPEASNLHVWHFLIHDLPDDTPYAGGIYHGVLTFPSTYPFAPPQIVMRTLNGRFATNESLCFSMSDWHPELWNPSWTVETILVGFLSFMLEEAKTTGSIYMRSSDRRRLALKSFKSVSETEVLREIFGDFLDHSKYDATRGFHHFVWKDDSVIASHSESPAVRFLDLIKQHLTLIIVVAIVGLLAGFRKYNTD